METEEFTDAQVWAALDAWYGNNVGPDWADYRVVLMRNALKAAQKAGAVNEGQNIILQETVTALAERNVILSERVTFLENKIREANDVTDMGGGVRRYSARKASEMHYILKEAIDGN